MNYPSLKLYKTFLLNGAVIGILFSSIVYWFINNSPFQRIPSECMDINQFDEIYNACKTAWSEIFLWLWLFSFMFLPWLTSAFIACRFKLRYRWYTILLLLVGGGLSGTLPVFVRINYTTISAITEILQRLAEVLLLFCIPILINLIILLITLVIFLPEVETTTFETLKD